MSIAIVCPTRGRPQSFTTLHDSMLATSSRTTLLAYLDDDDPSDYSALATRPRLQFVRGPRIGMVASVNTLCAQFPDFSAFGLAVDDATFATPNWDEWVLNALSAFPNRLGVISAHHPEARYVNFPYVSKEWIELLGWFAYPGGFHYCWDTVLEMLGDATAIAYAAPAEFTIVHTQLSAGLSEHYHSDCGEFLTWCVRERRTLVERIRAAQAIPTPTEAV